jgi:hypothetical protein
LGEEGRPAPTPIPRVPIIYCSDLYHPHDDPDDHFDLMTLFGLPEFEIAAILIDTGERGKGRPAIPALKQAMHITGRSVPYAMGLTRNLKEAEDKAIDQPADAQAGVELVLKTLRESPRPVTVFTTGSLRDMAAAYNRAPELFRRKVGRFYINAGHSGGKREWNVAMDPRAYIRILRSGLPVYWVPCFGVDGYASFWKFKQGDVLKAASRPVQNFFIYALTKADPNVRDPIAALAEEPPRDLVDRLWAEERNMWCTGAFLDAAGRSHPSFVFGEVLVHIQDDGTTRLTHDQDGVILRAFRVVSPETYASDMTRALRQALARSAPGSP